MIAIGDKLRRPHRAESCLTLRLQLLGRIMEGGVLEAFLDRGARFAPVLKDIPLIVVTNDMLGLLGARQYALKLLDENITEVR